MKLHLKFRSLLMCVVSSHLWKTYFIYILPHISLFSYFLLMLQFRQWNQVIHLNVIKHWINQVFTWKIIFLQVLIIFYTNISAINTLVHVNKSTFFFTSSCITMFLSIQWKYALSFHIEIHTVIHEAQIVKSSLLTNWIHW